MGEPTTSGNAGFDHWARTRFVRDGLRVVMVHETGDGARTPGRLVMSGRMADVCAELDRLVALENRH